MNIDVSKSNGHAIGAFARQEPGRTLVHAAAADEQALVKLVAGFVTDNATPIMRALSGNAPTLRGTLREPVNGSEIMTLQGTLGGIDAVMPLVLAQHGATGRAANITDQGFRLAIASGGVEDPGRTKQSTEFAALRIEMDRFVHDVTGGTVDGLHPSTTSLRALRESGLMDGAPLMSDELDKMLIMNDDDRVEQTRTDAMFSLMVLLMTLLMDMAEKDRTQAAVSLQKSESFVQAMGEKMVSSAKEHYKGAVIALATTGVIAVAGLAVGAFAAAKNVQSIKGNERAGIARQREAADIELGQAKGLAKAGPGESPKLAQSDVVKANNLRHQAALASAKHNMSFTQNAPVTQAGQAMTSLGNSAGSIVQSDGDVKAAEQSRIQENFRKHAETTKTTADNGERRAQEESGQVNDFRQRLSQIMDEMAATASNMTANIKRA